MYVAENAYSCAFVCMFVSSCACLCVYACSCMLVYSFLGCANTSAYFVLCVSVCACVCVVWYVRSDNATSTCAACVHMCVFVFVGMHICAHVYMCAVLYLSFNNLYVMQSSSLDTTSQLAFYVNLYRAVIGPSATLTGRWRPDINLRRMLTGIELFKIIKQDYKNKNI